MMDYALTYLFTLSKELWALIAAILGILANIIFNKFANKKKEALEFANAAKTGENLVIQVKTNVDKLIAEKTSALNAQIAELQSTIVTNAVQNKKNLEQYITKMASLEQRMDDQTDRTERTEGRNAELEKNLEAEILLRKACIAQLKNLQERVYELEKISNPISNKEKNNPLNPNNPNNTLANVDQ